MPPNGFLLAMCAVPENCGQGPDQALEPLPLWLIVSRFGEAGRYATVSLAQGAAPWTEMAPIGLAPSATMLGVRCTRTGYDCGFRFAEQLPDGLPVAGRFLPAAGVMRLDQDGEGLRLEAWGKLLGGPGPWGTVLAGGVASGDWHLRAGQRPWVGEFIEPARAAAQ